MMDLLNTKRILTPILVLILAVTFPGSYGQLTLTQGPTNQQVIQGASVTLHCVFNAAAKDCIWLKDGESTLIATPYQYLSIPELGDCSIQIPEVDLKRDSGEWECQHPRLPGSNGVRSQKAVLTVLVPPEGPRIFLDDEELSRGSTKLLENIGDNVTFECVTTGASPAANLYWMLGGQILNSGNQPRETMELSETTSEDGTANASIHSNSIEGHLKETRIRLSLQVSQDLRNHDLKCIAEHPSYNGTLHESYVVLLVHHNTTRVNVFTDKRSPGLHTFNSMTIYITPEEDFTLYCVANGVPEPTYVWEYQEDGADGWAVLSRQQNLTVRDKAGKFLCSAGNRYNVEDVKSFEEIVVEMRVGNTIENRNSEASSLTNTFISVLLTATTILLINV